MDLKEVKCLSYENAKTWFKSRKKSKKVFKTDLINHLF